jgi:glycerol-3-phosphate dehydrogenase
MPTMPSTPANDSATSFDRAEMLGRLATEQFDVLVVGGGITGVGVALDAASRGLRTALVERGDFAQGTSSKSSKLVHGGLRYLQQGEVRLVYEALRERQRLRKNAPHLVSVMPFMIPILGRPPKSGEVSSPSGTDQTKSVVNRKIARALGSAMWMYDLTGGWRIGKLHRRLNKDQALAHMPSMPSSRVLAAYLYYDAAVDDARLVLTVARTAAAHGAAVANGCAVVGFTHATDGMVNGVTAEADGRCFGIRATVVVNAAGVWSDRVRGLDEGADPDTIRPAKGVHVTVPWSKVRNDIAVVIPVPKDKRSLFVVPWGPNGDGTFRHSYVGTTDTDHAGPLDDPQCTADDLAYVLRALNASVDPAISGGITEADVTGVWAGLRPLVKSVESGRTADLSRRHSITRNANGVITVTGGKLTTYRQMAEDTVDEVLTTLGRKARCRTRRLRLLGTTSDRPVSDPDLMARHGALALEVMRPTDDDPSLLEPLVPGFTYLRAEALYAASHEMARTLDDVLTRRTRARLLDRDASLAAAPDVARLIAPVLGWDEAEIQRQMAAFTALCADEAAAGLVGDVEHIASVQRSAAPGGTHS